MKIKFWGVRGSIATPGPATSRFGGNTACIEVRAGDGRLLLDAGTGLRALGLEPAAQDRLPPLYLLLTHTHWDHIQGLPFFMPIYDAKNEIHLYGPRFPRRSLREVVLGQFEYPWFPVSGLELSARLHVHELQEEVFSIGPFTITSQFMNHPVLTLGYRIECGGRAVVYTGDHEPCYDLANLHAPDASPAGKTLRLSRDQVRTLVDRCNAGTAQFVRGADCLITDAQYTPEEYEAKRGWGHSSTRHAVDLGAAGRVRRLVLFHHDPAHTDDQLAAMEQEAAEAAKRRDGAVGQVTVAREGVEIEV